MLEFAPPNMLLPFYSLSWKAVIILWAQRREGDWGYPSFSDWNRVHIELEADSPRRGCWAAAGVLSLGEHHKAGCRCDETESWRLEPMPHPSWRPLLGWFTQGTRKLRGRRHCPFLLSSCAISLQRPLASAPNAAGSKGTHCKSNLQSWSSCTLKHNEIEHRRWVQQTITVSAP